MLKWAEISVSPDRARFDALSRALTEAGCENAVEYIAVDEAGFAAALDDAKTRFSQIRIGGAHTALAPKLTEHMPSMMLTLKVADSIVRASDASWWPRCFLVQGFGRALITDIKSIDLGGAAFILGATFETRAAVAALTKIGVSRFSISDPHEDRGRSLIEDLRSSHFGVQFQFVPRGQITQLPSVHSIGVNTLAVGQDDGALAELFYFNFLKPNGIWVDLALKPQNLDLAAEAKAVGAVIEPGCRVVVWTDVEWCKEALGVSVDPEKLATAYSAAYAAAV